MEFLTWIIDQYIALENMRLFSDSSIELLTGCVDNRPEEEAESHGGHREGECGCQVNAEQGLQPAHCDGGHGEGEEGEEHLGGGQQGEEAGPGDDLAVLTDLSISLN